MIEFEQYRDYVSHNRTFNAVFATSITLLISILVGILVYHLGWLRYEWGGFIITCLVAAPIIILIRELTKYEGEIAYHYIWKDRINGLRDKKLINEDYGKQHGISDWKSYLREREPDGRWNYHVYTKYMEQLVISRNSLLTKIAEEYAEKKSTLDAEIKNSNEQIARLASKRQDKLDELDLLAKKLTNAKTGAQEYHLENKLKEKRAELSNIKSQETQIKCHINDVQDELQRYGVAFIGQKNKIEHDYITRGNMYARIATKTIDKCGLKYEIEPLVSPDYWISNPTRKEII